MSRNSAKVSEKSGKMPNQVRKGQGICVVMEIQLWQLNKMRVTELLREL